MKQTYFILALMLGATVAQAQTTRYVNPNNPASSNNGFCTNPATPCLTIGHALEASNSGDIIDIAAAVYTEILDIDKSITLRGANQQSTIIQAHAQPAQAESRLVTIDGEYSVTITDLTIRHGVAQGDQLVSRRGGGIYNDGGTVLMRNVTVTENRAPNGGAGIYSINGSLTIEDSIISDNARNGTSSIGGNGIYSAHNNLVMRDVLVTGNSGGLGAGVNHGGPENASFTRVTFAENSSNSSGGGMLLSVHPSTTSPTVLEDVSFIGNSASNAGGLYLSMPTNTGVHPVILTNVTFTGNSVEAFGGGMYNAGDPRPEMRVFTNLTFTGNHAGNSGGAIYNRESSPMLTNVTLSGNSADQFGGAMYNFEESAPTLRNVILWNNRASGSTTSASASIFNVAPSTAHVSYSLIANSGGSADWNDALGVDEGNNIDADPLFITPINPVSAPTTAGDVRLNDDSPALNAGDPDTDPALFPVDDDGVALDMDGNPRFNGVSIDLGPYELQLADPPSPPENDNVADATEIPVANASYTGTNLYATLEDDEPEASCSFAEWNTNYSVWWTFTTTEDVRVTINTSGSQTPDGDGLNTVLSLHHADLAEIACDDNGGDGTQSLISDVLISGGATYLIRIAAYEQSAFNQGDIELDVTFQTVSGEPGAGELVTALTAAYPNPARNATTLTLSVDRTQDVTVEVFDVMGRRVQVLYEGTPVVGAQVPLRLDTASLSSGVYVIRATGEDFVLTRRVTVVR